MRSSATDDLIVRLRALVADEGDVSPTSAPPLSEKELHETEVALGFTLPALLARVYTEVANSGIGPGFGLLSGRLRDEPSLVSVYKSFLEGDWPEHLYADHRWPPALLPICDWGDAIWSCVDRSDE